MISNIEFQVCVRKKLYFDGWLKRNIKNECEITSGPGMTAMIFGKVDHTEVEKVSKKLRAEYLRLEGNTYWE